MRHECTGLQIARLQLERSLSPLDSLLEGFPSGVFTRQCQWPIWILGLALDERLVRRDSLALRQSRNSLHLGINGSSPQRRQSGDHLGRKRAQRERFEARFDLGLDRKCFVRCEALLDVDESVESLGHFALEAEGVLGNGESNEGFSEKRRLVEKSES